MKQKCNLSFLIVLLILGSVTPCSVFAIIFPPLAGVRAINGDWQPIDTITTFSGGFSVDNNVFISSGYVTTGRPVNIAGEINVDQKHVGQPADIIVYANVTTLDDPFFQKTLMLGSGGTDILEWNNEPATLIAFIPQVRLSAIQPVQIYNDFLPAGKLQIYFGYLSGSALVNNGQSIDITVEPLSSPEGGDGIRSGSHDPVVDGTSIISNDDRRVINNSPSRLVAQRSLRWPIGTVLKVGFDFSDARFEYLPAVCYPNMLKAVCEEVVATEVIKMASGWSQYGNIYFRKTTWADADIRVRFRENNSYSHVGMEYKGILSKDQETMNLAFSFLQTSEEFKATVLHEFGHAIGLYHEHYNPTVPYTWNEQQMVTDFAQLGWSEQQVRDGIIDDLLKIKSENELFTTAFDPHSIMIYPILKRWVSSADLPDPERCPAATTTPDYCVAPTTELSALDQQGIARFYPKNGDCSMVYEPSHYRPDTTEWDGHQGSIAFNNPTSSIIRVTLYHPDTPDWSFGVWDILPGKNVRFYQGEQPVTVSMDWGIRVNDSPICILKTVSLWDSSYFQSSTARMPGM
ncbi:MAG: hypothetical protein BWK79_02635 [Beggiatoa sp. IS2]|nr:MAG: hypothetical protein BWK79_02635 [Beggiatoa sp. IS2]